MFDLDDSLIDTDGLRNHPFINHCYAIHRDKLNFVSHDSHSASVSQVEAVAMLIQTGRFVGFLPQHYAAAQVARGQLRALRPFNTPFNLILRHNTTRGPLIKAFAQALGVDLKVCAQAPADASGMR